MKFTQLTLTNIGPFAGLQIIQFRAIPAKCIELICGSNGSGKTIFLESIAWCLGWDIAPWSVFGGTKLRHEALEEPEGMVSVMVAFTMRGVEYQVVRTAPKTRSSGLNSQFQAKTKTSAVEEWTLIDNPRQQLGILFPPIVQRTILTQDDGRVNLRTTPSDSSITLEVFRAWLQRRFEIKPPVLANARVMSWIKSWINGGSQSEAAGIICAGDLILLGLFREWIFTTEGLPDEIRHLAGEELPWLLDAPFGMMDNGLRTEVARNLVSQPQQCIIAGTPCQLSDPLETLLTPHVASVHFLKSGDNYFGGTSVNLFGRHVDLSRSDAQNFTEIVGE